MNYKKAWNELKFMIKNGIDDLEVHKNKAIEKDNGDRLSSKLDGLKEVEEFIRQIESGKKKKKGRIIKNNR